MLLTARGICKRYGAAKVLDGVGFDVREGEVLGLIGPNGAGKTTLFECLAGLMTDNGGTLKFRGKELAPLRRKDALFYLPDSIGPWEEQSVRWILGFFARLYPTNNLKVDELLEPLRLNSVLKSSIKSLSKGERKRVLLALGLLTPHPLLMLDEPFDGLDLRQTRDVMGLLREHAGRGKTLLLS